MPTVYEPILDKVNNSSGRSWIERIDKAAHYSRGNITCFRYLILIVVNLFIHVFLSVSRFTATVAYMIAHCNNSCQENNRNFWSKKIMKSRTHLIDNNSRIGFSYKSIALI